MLEAFTRRLAWVVLLQKANRNQLQLRPADPTTLDFQYDHEFEGNNFLKADLKQKSQRHLIFATDECLSLLAKAKTWYMDGTFKVVNTPFVQLFSIHAFVNGDSESVNKQVPLAFCLMSRRHTKDYRRIFKELVKLLDERNLHCRVENIVCDYEKATWRAARDIFPNVKVLGCFFHWSQAVLRKLRSVGLQTAYSNDSDIHNFCRLLFALPFLPCDKISHAFARLFRKANTAQLQELVSYVLSNWIDSKTWPPECWSVYRRVIRTNNDVEGWHHRLNAKARKNSLPLYVLIKLLYREASVVTWQVKFLSDGKVLRQQRKCYKSFSAKLEKLSDSYCKEIKSSRKLLHACSLLFWPKCWIMFDLCKDCLTLLSIKY